MDAVHEAVLEAGRMLRADGADLTLIDADPTTLRIRLALHVDEARCEECILPPDALHAALDASLRDRIPGEFELLVDDPRRA